MESGRYLSESSGRSDVLVASGTVLGATALAILILTQMPDWFLLTALAGGVLLNIFLVGLFATSLQLSSKRREVAILNALGAKRFSLFGSFLLRLLPPRAAGCLTGSAVGSLIVFYAIGHSSLPYEFSVLAFLLSFTSSFSGGAIAAKRILDFNAGEVLRE